MRLPGKISLIQLVRKAVRRLPHLRDLTKRVRMLMCWICIGNFSTVK